MYNLKALASSLIARTPIQYFPVTVQKGLARGASWTLFPYSANWRGNTELDVEAAIRLHGSIRGATCWDLGTHFGIEGKELEWSASIFSTTVLRC